jgi:Ca2+-binding EF-hand superfamily protein
MVISRLLTGMLAVAFVISSGLVAQEPEKEERQRRRARLGQRDTNPSAAGPAQRQGGPAQMMRQLPIIVALDKNKDGQLSADEINGAVAALKSLDKDGDGIVSTMEMMPSGGPRGQAGLPGTDRAASPEMMMRMFANRDADGDGKLSGDEIPEMMRNRLERIDENGDQAIDKDEFAKIAALMGNRGEQGRGPGRKQDGSGVKPKRPDNPAN